MARFSPFSLHSFETFNAPIGSCQFSYDSVMIFGQQPAYRSRYRPTLFLFCFSFWCFGLERVGACWGWMHRRRLVARLVLSCARLACCLSITVTLDRSRCEQRCISLRCQARAEAFAIYLLGRHRTRILLVYFFFCTGDSCEPHIHIHNMICR